MDLPTVFQIFYARQFLSRDAFHSDRRAIAMMFVCLSVCMFQMGMHCDHTVHFIAHLSLLWDSPVFWAP